MLENEAFLKRNSFNHIVDMNTIPSFPKFKSKRYSKETFELEDLSIYDYKVEIDRSVDISNLKKEVIFVFGVQSIKEIEWILSNKHEESIVIIFEPNPSFFKYALDQYNLNDIFQKSNIIFYIDNNLEFLNSFLQKIFYKFEFLRYLKNTNIYVTHYYRTKELQKVRSMIQIIRQIVHSVLYSFGNDLEDNLIGLSRNINNIANIARAGKISNMKGILKNKPAIIVSAGPSLNKNFDYLKKIGDRAIIFAVDTIAKKLIDAGIHPDFICSIERVPQVFDYFYKDLNINRDTIIAGASVVDSRVFESFNNNILIPLRAGIAETSWLKSKLGMRSEEGLEMGYSCAHIAFSLAEYLECSPIVLVGQDLAFGKTINETHVGGTKYDELLQTNKENLAKIEYTLGYDGENVATTKIWLQFKHWFEEKFKNSQSIIINATEGGAKINFTEQLKLMEVVEKYCQVSLSYSKQKLSDIPKNNVDLNRVKKKIMNEKEIFQDILKKSNEYKFILNSRVFGLDEIENILASFALYIEGIIRQPLLLHNLQSCILQYHWALNSRIQIFNEDFLEKEIAEQKKLIDVVIAVLDRIIIIFDSYLEK